VKNWIIFTVPHSGNDRASNYFADAAAFRAGCRVSPISLASPRLIIAILVRLDFFFIEHPPKGCWLS
jgi:hypothetical protein